MPPPRPPSLSLVLPCTLALVAAACDDATPKGAASAANASAQTSATAASSSNAPIVAKHVAEPPNLSEPPRRQADIASCTGDTKLVPGVPGSPGHLIDDAANPNGLSELASLMRTMRADMARVRADVLAKKPTRIAFVHHRLRCSWPTSAGDRNDRFDSLAVSYLEAVDRFNQTAGEQPDARAYDAVVDSCLGCHASACTGAMVAIRPLRIAEADGGE